MSNALLTGKNREAIFSAALAHAAKGSRIIDPGCPLTPFGDMVEVGVARGHAPRTRVRLIAVNIKTHEAFDVIDTEFYPKLTASRKKV